MKKITNLLPFIFAFSLLILGTNNALAQTSVGGKSCVGTWKTVDDETGRTKSHVKIFKKGDKYYGKIVKLLDKKTLEDSGEKRFEDIKCEKCPSDHGKNKPLVGLEMLWGMEQQSNRWASGKIMDPKKGKIYTCTMWMDDSDSSGDTLKVRGWVAMFYRTQTWYRIK